VAQLTQALRGYEVQSESAQPFRLDVAPPAAGALAAAVEQAVRQLRLYDGRVDQLAASPLAQHRGLLDEASPLLAVKPT